jgi:arylsulfatase A-like enzyme
VDLAPTILEALGVPAPPGLPGRSLQSILATGEGHEPAPAYLLEHGWGLTGMRLGRWLVIAHRRYTSMARIDGCRAWYQDPERHPVMWMYLRERLAPPALAATPPP